jgi:hypothetical protein
VSAPTDDGEERRRDLQRAVAAAWPGPWWLQPVLIAFGLAGAAGSFRRALGASSLVGTVVGLVICGLTLGACVVAFAAMRAKWALRDEGCCPQL